MDERPSPTKIPPELLNLIRDEKNWVWLCQQWDSKYPDNPVSSNEDQDDGDKDDSADPT
jgi:hypothetical protein